MLLISIISNTIAQTTHTVSISVASASGKEGDSGETFKTVTVNLSQEYTQKLTTFTCYSGTAAYNNDFQLTPTGTGTSFIDIVRDCRPFTFSTGSTSFRFRIKVLGDAVDEPDETVILSLENLRINSGADPAPAGIVNSPTAGSVTFTIEDDDPTIVSLTRSGSTGAVSEGEMVEFTVILSRTLIAGEIIDVPLSIGGIDVTTADWNLAPKTSAGLNTGLTLSDTDAATPQVRFSGAGADTATLVLTPVVDAVTDTETFTIALGPDGDVTNGFDRTSLATNLGGGADPSTTANSFNVQVNNTPPPSAPTGLTTTAGNKQIALSWTDPGNSTIDDWQYRQKVGSGSFGNWMDIPNSTAATTTHTVTNLTNGTAYTFEVRARAGIANSPSSNQAMTTPFRPEITITGGMEVTEGTAAAFIVSASPMPTSNLTVNLSVAEAAGSSFVNATNKGIKMVTIPASSGSMTYTVATADDNMDESNGSVTVTVTNNTSYIVGSPSSAMVTINDDDATPKITSLATASVAEGTTGMLKVTATDADAGTTLTYSITAGADSAQFSINARTGDLMFKIAPDFEGASTDGDDDYEVIVTVSDGTNSAMQTITVTVTDVNDNSPMITSPATASVAENTTAVLTVMADDADEGTTLTYTITGGVDSARFSLDQSTGDLAFKTAPDFEAPGSADNDNIYEVEVTASDGTNSASQTVAVTVTDVNDNNPMITSPARASVVEGTTVVLTITATDADAGTILNYSISGGADSA